MNLFRRHLSVGIFAAAAAGLTWAVATGNVENYPAYLHYTVDLPTETISNLTVEANLTTGGTASATVPGGAGVRTVDLLVNGGSEPEPGLSYNTRIYAYLSNPGTSQTYLSIYKNTPVLVDNTVGDSPTTVASPFVYPQTRHVNASVSVTGGPTGTSLYYFSVTASASRSTPNESYYGSTSLYPSGTPSSASTWVPILPVSNVQIYGTAYVRNPDNTYSQRSLAGQIRDLSAGDASVSWTIDLSGLAHLEGDVALSLPPGTTPSSYNVQYSGNTSATSGYYGNMSLAPATPHYAFDMPPGGYGLYLTTNFSSPYSYANLGSQSVILAAGNNPAKNFTEVFHRAKTDLAVTGFYGNNDLAAAQSYLRTPTWSKNAQGYQRTGSTIEQLVPQGDWRSYYTYLSIYNQSNPLLPTNSSLYRYHMEDPGFPIVAVDGTAATPSLGTEAVTLVKSNIYFDVVEPTNSVQVTSPRIDGYKLDYNPNGSQRSQSSIYAYGSGTPQLVSGFTVVGEPGTYTFRASATVNGQLTVFGRGANSITFGTPVATPPGAPEVILADQTAGSFLHLSLSFDNVGTPGITTVVENPLGPAPPEGFSMSCTDTVLDDNGQSICDPLYYDIATTAQWSGTAKVCLRRRSVLPNGVAEELLKLFHYAPTGWEQLPPPADGSPAFFDCSADSLQCGCATNEACGIDYVNDIAINTYLICGETTSFSPFVPLIGAYHFSNEVNDVEYTGPTGPPALQQWVVPSDGTYSITASGASGARANAAAAGIDGGCGAEVTGEFALQAGDVIEILVGQKGIAATNSAGGGGGTFLVKNGTPILIAGGGGGVRAGATVDGRSGVLGTAGTQGSTSASYASGFIAGGANGTGGARVASYGSGGGGWSGNGAADGNYGEGGFSFLSANQGRGGAGKTCAGGLAHGGYGGGGAGNGCYGGGGGGGYSGGGGGRVAGGGGSLNTGAHPTGREGAAACTPSGHGQVTVKYLHL